MTNKTQDTTLPSRLLIVDDDTIFCDVLTRSMEKRGYQVRCAHSVDSALALVAEFRADRALIDLNMPGESGLVLIEAMRRLVPHIDIVVLTGFASIATAVEAIKLGAIHYLAKPADADEILAAFERDDGQTEVDIASRPMSVNRLEWEHIQKVLHECDSNISETARRLGMHRRTLQRKLAKKPVRH